MCHKYPWDTLAKLVKTNKCSRLGRDNGLYGCMPWIWSQGQSPHAPGVTGFHSDMPSLRNEHFCQTASFPQPHPLHKLLTSILCSLTNSAFCDWEVTMVHVFLGHTSQSWHFRNQSPNCTSAFTPQHSTSACSCTTNSSHICHAQFHFWCYMSLPKCKTNSQAATKAVCPFSVN